MREWPSLTRHGHPLLASRPHPRTETTPLCRDEPANLIDRNHAQAEVLSHVDPRRHDCPGAWLGAMQPGACCPPRSFASAISLACHFRASFRTMELLCGADVICSFRVRRCARPRVGAEGVLHTAPHRRPAVHGGGRSERPN
eukprot:4931308-Pyramimonas_sp.AAC.2